MKGRVLSATATHLLHILSRQTGLSNHRATRGRVGNTWRKKNEACLLSQVMPAISGITGKVTELSKVGIGTLAFVVSKESLSEPVVPQLLARCRQKLGIVGGCLNFFLQDHFCQDGFSPGSQAPDVRDLPKEKNFRCHSRKVQ